MAWAPGVRLDVDVVGAREQRQRAVAGEVLGDVHVLAAAVVALAGQALGVLVGEPRALRLEHRRVDVVLARDQLDLVRLAVTLRLHRRPQLGVQVRDRRPGGGRRGRPTGGGLRRGDGVGHGRTSWRDGRGLGWRAGARLARAGLRGEARAGRPIFPRPGPSTGGNPLPIRGDIPSEARRPCRAGTEGGPWTSESSSSERCEAIMTPSPSSPAGSSRGWTRRPASSSGTPSSRETRSRRDSSAPGGTCPPSAIRIASRRGSIAWCSEPASTPFAVGVAGRSRWS